LSLDRKPDTGPDAYWMLNTVPLAAYVLLFVWSYLLCSAQASCVHSLDATHRLDEPVSKMTLKGWGGEPMEMGP